MRVGVRQAGFTILEVLVAFVVAALLLSVILGGFSQGLSNLRLVDQRAQAVLVAQSRMAEIGVVTPLQPGVFQGVENADQPFRWVVNVTPLEWEYAARVAAVGAVLYRVQVEVSWGEPGVEKSLSLVSLRTFREVAK